MAEKFRDGNSNKNEKNFEKSAEALNKQKAEQAALKKAKEEAEKLKKQIPPKKSK